MSNKFKRIDMCDYKILVFVLLLLPSTKTLAQAEAKTDIFDSKSELTWLGIDFTSAKFMGDGEKFRIMDLPILLKSWNDLMVKEQKKYNIPKMLHRKAVVMSLDVTTEHNAGLRLNNLLTDDVKLTKRMNLDSVASIVSSYDFKGLSGNGIMFNVESFNKIDQVGYVWITFVNMDNKTVLFTRRLGGRPGGFSPRNYWAHSIYEIIQQVNFHYYRQWSDQQL